VIGPLFKWFGSKWLSAKALPAPEWPTIYEPYAGGAGYSLRHHERNVLLAERNVHAADLWRWLIETATEASIREIPIGIPEGTDIQTLELSYGQALLLKSWQRTNNVGDCWTISPWGNKPGQWTANTRSRVAEQSQAIKHWRFVSRWAEYLFGLKGEGTWFIDPPYQFNYDYRNPAIDHQELGAKVLACAGQVIVCEAAHPKTGAIPAWLPFREFGSRVTSRRKATEHHHSRELIWTSPSVAAAPSTARWGEGR